MLLTLFCSVSIFSQDEINNKQKLVTKLVFIHNSKFVETGYEIKGDSENQIIDENSPKASKLFSESLSRSGSIKIDTTGKTLIVTDNTNRVKLIENFVEILDRSNFDFDQLFSRNPDGTGLYSLKVEWNNLSFSISCGMDKKYGNWKQEQTEILFSVIKNLVSKKGSFEINSREKNLTVTDNWNRVILIREITELFDKQFIEETK